MDRSKLRESDTIYDVYHIVVIVYFHQFWCGQTYMTNAQSKGSSRYDRSVQAEKVKSVNKTGISGDQCRILMDVTSNLSDLIPLSE